MIGSERESCVKNSGTKCRTARIAELNDVLRRYGTSGKIVMTRGVIDLAGDDVPRLLTAIAAFDDFDRDNDPYGERDFGGLDFNGKHLLWKIDYYDKAMEFGSDDPADAAVTTRVLTIMLDSEY